MTTTIATIPCAHDGCDRPAVWHFFSTDTGNLDTSTCGLAVHWPEYDDDDVRAVHTKDAFEIVNRMYQEAGRPVDRT